MHCFEICGLFSDIGLIDCFVLFVCGVSLSFEVLFMPEKGLDDRAQLCQLFLQVLVDISIGLNFSVAVSVVNDLLRFCGVESFGVDSGHGFGNSVSAGGYDFCVSLVVALGGGIELFPEFLFALLQLFSKGLFLLLHLILFKSI